MTDIRRHKSLRTQTGFYDRREQVLKLFERISTEHGDVRAISLQELVSYPQRIVLLCHSSNDAVLVQTDCLCS